MKSKQSFRDYLWSNIKRPIILSGLALTLLFVAAYAAVVTTIKKRQLDSSLLTAAQTVEQTIDAGDWPMGLSHLRAMETNGPVFHITLKNHSDSSNVSGPFGHVPSGVGKVCSSRSAGDSWLLSGCMRLFAATELVTLGLFLVFALITSGFTFFLFKFKTLYFVDKIARELDTLRSNRKLRNNRGSEPDVAEISAIRRHIEDLIEESESASKSLALNRLSLQVAHDIRSPLAALDAVLVDIAQIPESKRTMLRSAIGRIRDIANNLIEKNRRLSQQDTPNGSVPIRQDVNVPAELLFPLLDAVVSEKRIQYRSCLGVDIGIEPTPTAYGIFSLINRSEFSRIISNVVDNAVEAVDGSGSISVCVTSVPENAIVEVTDNGKGIPADVLPYVTERGKSFGKQKGSGLGLFHANQIVGQCGGTLQISSRVGKGTVVRISLPKCPEPEWFVSNLSISLNTTIVIVDDDHSIHDVWRDRFSTRDEEAIRCHFTTPDQLIRWKEETEAGPILSISLTTSLLVPT